MPEALMDHVLMPLAKIGIVVGLVMGIITYLVLAERKILGFIQVRVGPNRVGPWGLLQPIADVAKLLAKDPKLRYPSAHALRDDLRRFLDMRPIRARRVSAAEWLWRWCQRNPLTATCAAVIAGLLVLVFTTLLILRLYYNDDRLRRMAQEMVAQRSGAEVEIEQRKPDEVLELAGRRIAATGAGAWNPAFDVTPAELVDCLVTERGVVRRPDRAGLENLVAACQSGK